MPAPYMTKAIGAEGWGADLLSAFAQVGEDVQNAGTGTAKIRVGTRAERLAATPTDGLVWLERDQGYQVWVFNLDRAAWEPPTLPTPEAADNAATIADLHSDNAIINGCCRVITRAKIAISGSYQFGEVDRWAVCADGSPTGGDIRQAPLSASVSGKSCTVSSLTQTGAEATVYFRTRIEGKDSRFLRNSPAIFVIGAWHNVGAPIDWLLRAYIPTAEDNFAAVDLAGNTGWISVPDQALTLLALAVPDMGTNAGNGIELQIRAKTGPCTAKNISICDARLTPGQVAPSFQPRLLPIERLLCSRYVTKSYNPETAPGTVTSAGQRAFICDATNQAVGAINFPVPMRTTPTVTLYSPISGGANTVRTGGANLTGYVGSIGRAGFGYLSGSGYIVGNGCYFQYLADAEL